MRTYEVLYILSPQVPEEEANAISTEQLLLDDPPARLLHRGITASPIRLPGQSFCCRISAEVAPADVRLISFLPKRAAHPLRFPVKVIC